MTIRLCIAVFCLLAAAAVCLPSSARPRPYSDAWVKARVDSLVKSARAAYEDDKAIPAYRKVLRSLSLDLRRAPAREEGFVRRYRQLVDYVEAAALDQQSDHELGFLVPDRQYFAETRQYVQIPEFLTDQRFLRIVSRSKTLGLAKDYLRAI